MAASLEKLKHIEMLEFLSPSKQSAQGTDCCALQADFSLGLATIDERRKISNLLIYSYKYDFYIFIWNRNWTLNIQNWTLENLKVTTLGSIESH